MPPVRVSVDVLSAGYLRDQPSQGKGGFWTVEYYQPYFDVDTQTVRTLPSHSVTLSTNVFGYSGSPKMLCNSSPNVIKLSIDALESRRPLRPVLDIDNPNLHALPFLKPSCIHIRLSLWSRLRI